MARPLELIVAMLVLLELQVTCELTSVVLVVPSAFLNVPMASNCCVPIEAMVGFVGEIVSAVRAFTLSVALVAVMPDAYALIVVVPAATPVATPATGSIVATAVFVEAQVTEIPGVMAPLL